MRELERRSGVDDTVTWRIRRGNQRGVCIRHLRKILSFLECNYDLVTRRIESLGAVKDPRLPFNLRTLAGSRLIGRSLGDGGLSFPTKTKRTVRFGYVSADRDAEERAVADIREIFGNIYVSVEGARGPSRIRVSCSVVGECLRRVGIPIGRKTESNPPLPLVFKSCLKIQRDYLRQAYDDEGTAYKRRMRMSRAVVVPELSKAEDKMRSLPWKEKMTRTGKLVSVDLSEPVRRYLMGVGLMRTIQRHPPRLLSDERRLLCDNFNVETRVIPYTIYKVRKGYAVLWTLDPVAGGNAKKLREEIGFSLARKKKKIRKLIRIIRLWTRDEEGKLTSLVKKGLSDHEIARILDRTVKSVATKRLRLGLKKGVELKGPSKGDSAFMIVA